MASEQDLKAQASFAVVMRKFGFDQSTAKEVWDIVDGYIGTLAPPASLYESNVSLSDKAVTALEYLVLQISFFELICMTKSLYKVLTR